MSLRQSIRQSILAKWMKGQKMGREPYAKQDQVPELSPQEQFIKKVKEEEYILCRPMSEIPWPKLFVHFLLKAVFATIGGSGAILLGYKAHPWRPRRFTKAP